MLSNWLFELDSLLTVVESGIGGSSSDSDSQPHDGDSGVSKDFNSTCSEIFSELKVVLIRHKHIFKVNVCILH